MKLLLDTHAFLWWLLADRRLSKSAAELLHDPENTLHLSAAVGWEIATKHRIGKLPEGADILRRLNGGSILLAIEPLPISMEHAVSAGLFIAAHRDPFDRVIAAQGRIEGMSVVTNDPAFQEFSVQTVW